MSPTTATLLRSTHGNPPLLAVAAVAPAAVIAAAHSGKSDSRRTRARVHSCDALQQQPSARILVSTGATIPPRASAATFQVSTAAVAAASSVNINATYNSVTQTAKLALVAPYSLSRVTVDPASQFGGFTAQGAVVLSGPADSAATVYCPPRTARSCHCLQTLRSRPAWPAPTSRSACNR